MTLFSELLQLLVIIGLPTSALILFTLFRRKHHRNWIVISGAMLIATMSYFQLHYHTIFQLGMLCPVGERMVEGVPASIFSSYGDQQLCVPDTFISSTAEMLARIRPIIQIVLSVTTWILCIAFLLKFIIAKSFLKFW